MQTQEMETIHVSVERVVFSNSDSGFAVLEAIHEDTLLCVVGLMYDVQAGEELDVTGYFATHPTYGHQFKAQACTRTLPATAIAIQKYLASGAIKGIGPALAKRIVAQFGDQTLEILEQNPERLSEVKGVTPKRCQEFAQSFQQMFGVRSLMLFLSTFGINPGQSVQIWKKWGTLALDLIKRNPFILCTAQFGIGFEVTDRIADEYELPKDDYHRLLAGVSYVLLYNLNNGHTSLPREKVLPMAQKVLRIERQTIDDSIDLMIEKGELCAMKRHKEFLLLPDYDRAERYIAHRVALLVSIPPVDPPVVDHIIAQIEQEHGIVYEQTQKTGIKQAMRSDLFILTGRPGTGKTTTLNGIIELLEYQGKEIAIAAPTGRAAKRISEVTGREAKTIHRMLEVEFKDGSHRFARNEQEPLKEDVVVIDEMSMVDTLLFEALLRALKPAAKLILVGDYNQLPSVGAGNVLQDLLDSDVVASVALKQIFRQAAQSLIVTNAHSIVEGNLPDLDQKDNDFFFLARQTAAAAAQTVEDLMCTRLPKSYNFSPMSDIQVLCPGRKGELGVTELNRRMQQQLNPPAKDKPEVRTPLYTYRLGDKVMQIKNNYDIEWTRGDEKGLGVFNGDIGVIQMVDRGSQTMAICFEDRVAYYAFSMVDELELAYAVTVHKAQGSEFEAVILPIMDGYDKLYYRNLLYTAITRAKQLLIIVGRQERVEFMVHNHIKSVRYTNLRALLQQGITDQ